LGWPLEPGKLVTAFFFSIFDFQNLGFQQVAKHFSNRKHMW
jgi:hypothetical protein